MEWQWEKLFAASGETLLMVFIAMLFAYLIGIPLGVVLVGTRKDGIFPNKYVNSILGWIVNTFRSVPFVILLVAIVPVTRIIMGIAIGFEGIVFPLIIASIPFVARMVETSVLEIDKGMIEAAKAMGASNLQIIFNIYLPESIPSLIRGAAITSIAIIGYTAMAGTVDGGGLGQYAINEGHLKGKTERIWPAVIFLIVIVELFQLGFNFLANRLDKKRG